MNKKKEYTIEIEGGRVTGTIPRLSSFFGVDYETVKQRIRRGWTVEQALELTDAPPHKVVTASQEQVDLIAVLVQGFQKAQQNALRPAQLHGVGTNQNAFHRFNHSKQSVPKIL